MKFPVAAALAAALTSLFAGTASTQTGPLIGFTASTTNPSSNITLQRLCNPPTTVCSNALPPPTQPWAGGLAYDPMRDAVWHSEGTRIFEIDRTTCRTGCLVPATGALGAGSLVSGLTIDPATARLYELETVAGVAAVTEWQFSASARCPRALQTCRILLPSRSHHAGAIAFDQSRRLIYVATSVFNSAAPANILLVFRQGDPACTPICRIPVDQCLNGILQSIRAMAYDECSETMYISDGRQTSAQRAVFTPGSPCPILRPISCCPLAHPRGEFWQGFDVQSILARRLGSSCTQRPCPSCPNMTFDAVGAAVPGNASFGFRFDNAPSGTRGYAVLNFGGCSSTPLFCGTLYPALAPPPIVLGPVLLSGAGSCGGTGFIPVPVPNHFNLCNRLLCVQGLVVCSSPVGLGVGLTNAVVVPIGS